MLLPRLIPLAALLALAVIGSPALLPAQPQEVYPVRSSPSAQSLNGQWAFKYIAGSEIGTDVAFSDPAFNGCASWQSAAVPGHWELQGFAEPKYATVDDGMGLYRRTFSVPKTWEGQRVFLHFDGVLYGFDVWVNGTKIGSWASAYNPVAFDITDALQPDGANVLAVRVSTRSHGWAFDTNDCWALSGIYRDVTLFAVPATHFVEFRAHTELNSDGTASLSVSTLTTLDIPTLTHEPAKVSGRLLDPQGQSIAQLSFSSDKTNVSFATFIINHPQLWSAETPALYTLELTLSSRQRISERIGLREITIKDGVLLLNGHPIKLRGVDHHDIWPVNGRAATEEQMRQDLELIRAANCNFVRTSHYPPHPRLIELCDELGLYVMDEVPFGFGEEHLSDPAYQESLFTRACATVRRDRNRPSVIIWSVGNENENTPLTIATGRRVKELDPTRPICFPQMGHYFAKSYPELPDDIDIYAPHYPSTATVAEYAAKLTRPVIFTEYAHALGLASDQIQAQWAIMQASPRIAGGAIWMFQDQGILRTADPTQSPATTYNLGLAVWPDATHYYDTAGNLGMDGIVYSDRTAQVDYWQVRKVYSPVQIAEQSATVQPGKNQITLHVENRFDFRALNGITLAWSLLQNGAPIQQGVIPLRAEARTAETVMIPLTLPASMGTDVFTLDLRCSEAATASFYERTVRLDTLPAASRLTQLTAHLPQTPLELNESESEIRITHDGFSLVAQRSGGEISLCDPLGRLLAAGFLPHIGRRFTEGESVRAKKELTWTGALLHASAAPEITANRTDENIELRVRGRYVRPDAPDQSLEGELRLLIRPDGAIEASYDYTPVNGRGMLLEAGLSLTVPATASEFRWLGAGPYAGYPGKDSLNEYGLYHLSRFDLNFQGNRRRVELALLTNPTGAGIALGGTDLEVAVEREEDRTIFSHNAVLSGRGTKFVAPDTVVTADTVGRIAGKFTLLPLTNDWPEPLRAWFGPPTARVKIAQPFYHSYDQ